MNSNLPMFHKPTGLVQPKLNLKYGIGIKNGSNYAMIDGPVNDIWEMLDVIGNHGQFIFSLDGGNPKPVYVWRKFIIDKDDPKYNKDFNEEGWHKIE